MKELRLILFCNSLKIKMQFMQRGKANVAVLSIHKNLSLKNYSNLASLYKIVHSSTQLNIRRKISSRLFQIIVTNKN